MALDTAVATAIKRGITRRFDMITDTANDEQFYPMVSTIMPSTGSDEQYAFLGSMPGVREWLGDRDFNQLRAGDFLIKNKLWESSVLLDRHKISDDRLAMFNTSIDDLAIEATNHPDELLFDVLLAGGTDLCWDGIAFFSASHVWGDSGTQSNIYAVDPAAGAGNAIVAGDCKSAVGTARAQMLRFQNDQGKYFNRTTMTTMRNVMILTPPELEQQFVDGLFTNNYQLTQGVGGDNKLAGIVPPTLKSSPLLTDTRVFYIFNMGRALKPFIFQDREKLQSQAKGGNDIETKDILFMTEARYNVGYGAWMAAMRVTFN